MFNVIWTAEEQCLCSSSTSDTLNLWHPVPLALSHVKKCLMQNLPESDFSKLSCSYHKIIAWIMVLEGAAICLQLRESVLQDIEKIMSFEPDSNIWQAHICITCFYVIFM